MMCRGIATFLKERYSSHRQYLIIFDHPYFSQCPYQQFLDCFDNIHLLPFCIYQRNPLKEFSNIRSLRRALFDVLKNKNEEAVFLIGTVTKTELSVNLLLRIVRNRFRRVNVLAVGTYFRAVDRLKTNNWKSWLAHNVYFLLGAYPLKILYKGQTLIERQYYRESDLIDHHLVLSHRWSSHPEYTEIRYPEMKRLAGGKRGDERYVLFLGDTILPDVYPQIQQDRFIQTTNNILKRLTELYQNEDVILYYKGHPNKGFKDIPFDLSGFQLYEEPHMAEMIYIMLRDRIRAVYSIVSTSSRTADVFGINTYVFFEMFGFGPDLDEYWRKYLVADSNVTSIRNLEDLQVAPNGASRPAWTGEDCQRLSGLFAGFGLD